MEYIDSHCHLDFEPLQPVEQTITAARNAGVSEFIVPGVSPGEWSSLQSLSSEFDCIHCAFGVHPWWIKQCLLEKHSLSMVEKTLARLVTEPYCLAVGETGLDGKADTPMTEQLQWFEAHVRLACEAKKPLIIHAVNEHPRIQKVLKRYRPPCGGVIHGFSGSYELGASYWKMGFYLGVGGTITYPRANKTRNAVSRLPLECLLLETDSPDMPLNGRQGETNYPQFLPLVAEELASLRGVAVEEVALQTSENARCLFALPIREPVKEP
ncbi:TatD family hydrolase [Marinibactrum halimedae]|uniref:Deoxyribonuclease n=1 Tax=Marinibactrum halimedae TaxID=1444977 RepID=A0AA37TCE4_9GAMM|nr:TatD family hydrolase [Marinibactrum halimedae]MCD9461023.1 TatD family hydrolase [Marinibactrum halimedae]GLS27791.1 deoxyribonuclease [Marinibactrum halimedae]